MSEQWWPCWIEVLRSTGFHDPGERVLGMADESGVLYAPALGDSYEQLNEGEARDLGAGSQSVLRGPLSVDRTSEGPDRTSGPV